MWLLISRRVTTVLSFILNETKKCWHLCKIMFPYTLSFLTVLIMSFDFFAAETQSKKWYKMKNFHFHFIDSSSHKYFKGEYLLLLLIFGKYIGIVSWRYNSLLTFGQVGRGIYWLSCGVGIINHKQLCCHGKSLNLSIYIYIYIFYPSSPPWAFLILLIVSFAA